MRNMGLSFFLLLLIVPSAVLSQETPTPGDRVRITSRAQHIKRLDGRLISMTGDSVLVEVQRLRTIRYRDVMAPDTITAPLAALDRVEVSRGGGRRTLRGALIGGSLAAILGYIAASGFDSCSDCSRTRSPEVQGVIGAGVFGAGGALIGALVGSGIHWERWQEVGPLRGGMLLRPLPQGGVGMGLTLRINVRR